MYKHLAHDIREETRHTLKIHIWRRSGILLHQQKVQM